MSPEIKGQTNGAGASGTQEVRLTVSSSPHVRCNESISKIMWSVVAALVPAAAFGVYYFGMNALINIIVSIVSAVVFEYLWEKLLHKKITIKDGSAVITGLLLAMCVSPLLPWWMCIVGSFLAIVVCKQSMGGLGYNLFNPAHVGRAGLMVSWPVAMTTWTQVNGTVVDGVAGATPLNVLKHGGHDALLQLFGGDPATMYQSLFFGFRNGSMGETSTVLLVLGGLFLIYKGYVKWQAPVVMIATVGIMMWIFGGVTLGTGLFSGDPLFHMMAGGLIIGAFFMSTDMVTAPITLKGQIIFALGAGLITVLIRLLGGYPEGVCYSILLMNAVTPLIDRLVKPRIFGSVKAKGAN
ncbi:RnfABCDGE type electron transport complex subunit D [Megasphaera vaginalis (ex Srinivasan et al. 2021)]|uniref:Ion-translocating oxidoreductase complex subunit D n=1 Tax=Megasphaera vaginalis (ex Srinivasan et al. 2021) TaxID=1111454 RepID=U7UC79_9FIRM|nr:RnfABCDGE type electron transport complex subunit D [Megasphaera vaginalis (ex Srinivasan et al. 2021)]ERT56459.1 electron transport complex, RnfABCDGE type, D subunit [Megasphaera vaginalis (ex Srinivasan et al. 2021)]